MSTRTPARTTRGARGRRAGLGAALLVLLAPLAPPLGAQTPRAECRGCETRADERVYVEERALERQIVQVTRRLDRLAQRYAGDEAVERTLRDASLALREAKGTGPEAARELARVNRELAVRAHKLGHDQEFVDVVRQLTALETRAAFATVMQAPAPSGYLGVTYSGEQERKTKNGELFIYHYEYPVVISVMPRSPAHKAGVRAGDTVLAYNDQDVRKGALSLTKLLQPGETVTLRVRRNGAVREVPVKVEPRVRDVRAAPRVAIAPRPAMPPMPPMPPMEPMVTVAPGAAGEVSPFFHSATTSVVAGAELTPMNEDLREVFGTERGTLVLRVADRSPAHEAGLRGGDVIVSANGEAVTSPAMLRRALFAAADDGELSLEVVRKKQKKVVKLRW